MIFKTEPKSFATPADRAGYMITGVSCRININEISFKDGLSCTFTFYTQDKLGTWFMKETVERDLKLEVEVPGLGKIPIVSMLFSPKPTEVYKSASILAGAYGFKLLPFADQEDLTQKTPSSFPV